MKYVVTLEVNSEEALATVIANASSVNRVQTVKDDSHKQAVRALKSLGWKQDDLAVLFATSQSTISAWLKEDEA